MKIKNYKCKCGHDDFFIVDKGNPKGIHCSYCGKWLKWADKDEQNLRMKQEASVLNKIRAEILDEAELSHEDFDGYKKYILHIEPYGIPDDDFRYGLRRAVEIIDKYKAKGEEE